MKRRFISVILIILCALTLCCVFSACDFFKPTEIVVPKPPVTGDPENPPPETPDHICDYICIITVRPTESREGKAIYRCYVCGNGENKQEKVLPVLSQWTKTRVIEPTCTQFGKDEYKYELNIGSANETREVKFSINVPTADHTYGDWEIKTAPSGKTEGTAERTCGVCKTQTEQKRLPVLSHWTASDDTATCESGGEILYTLSVDGYAFSYIVETQPKGHLWDEWQVVPATCTQKGEKYRLCKLDSSHREDGGELPIIPHDRFTEFDEYSHWEECRICGGQGDKQQHVVSDFECSICDYKTPEANLIYTLNSSGTYAVTGWKEDGDIPVIIPERYAGRLVSEISEGAFAGKKISGLTLPAANFKIGVNAFTQAEISAVADFTFGKVTIAQGAFSYAKAEGFAFRTDTVINYNAFLSVQLNSVAFEGNSTQWETFKANLPEGCVNLRNPKTLKFVEKNDRGCKNHFRYSTDEPLSDDEKHWFICADPNCNEIIFERGHTYNAGNHCIICGKEKKDS